MDLCILKEDMLYCWRQLAGDALFEQRPIQPRFVRDDTGPGLCPFPVVRSFHPDGRLYSFRVNKHLFHTAATAIRRPTSSESTMSLKRLSLTTLRTGVSGT